WYYLVETGLSLTDLLLSELRHAFSSTLKLSR
ncbi:hypothetical protein A2U01_0085639, partial [Trifolium medium]|nr:hypothetical protein [Trifolium medium]